jgi:hypothetical protein
MDDLNIFMDLIKKICLSYEYDTQYDTIDITIESRDAKCKFEFSYEDHRLLDVRVKSKLG